MLLLALLACGPDPENDSAATATSGPCDVGDVPALQIASPNPVVALAVGTTLDLVTGPQGGHHVEIGLVGVGIDASATLDATLLGWVAEAEVARAVPRIDFSCDPSSGNTLARNLLVILHDDVLPADLDGQTMRVQADLVDAAGRSVHGALDVSVVDRTGG